MLSLLLMPEVFAVSSVKSGHESYDEPLLNSVEVGVERAYIPDVDITVIPSHSPEDYQERLHRALAIFIGGVPPTSEYDSTMAEALEPEWREIIHNTPTSVEGHCLGGQLLSRIYGGIVMRFVEAENGLCVVEVAEGQQANPLFGELGPRFLEFSSHWASTSVPEEFRRLASTKPSPETGKGCHNFMSQHKDPNKLIVINQGHQELTPEELGSGYNLTESFIRAADKRHREQIASGTI